MEAIGAASNAPCLADLDQALAGCCQCESLRPNPFDSFEQSVPPAVPHSDPNQLAVRRRALEEVEKIMILGYQDELVLHSKGPELCVC